MQIDQKSKLNDFRQTLNKIDYFCHLKEFKSIAQSKITHLKSQKRFQPSDYYLQLRKLILHLIYLFYVAKVKKVDIYLYPQFCINRWGVIFQYYSLQKTTANFMKLYSYKDFYSNVKEYFSMIWNIKTAKQIEEENKQELQGEKNLDVKKNKNSWIEFAQKLFEILTSKQQQSLDPKILIQKIEQTKHMKNNILLLGVLSSTIFPCIKFNKQVQNYYKKIRQQQHWLINKIFSGDSLQATSATVNFTKYLFDFFKVLNEKKVLGITTTMSDKQLSKSLDEQSLLTQFKLSIGRIFNEKKIQQSHNSPKSEDKNPTSNRSSEKDYAQGNQEKDLGQLKCQYFWTKALKIKQLTFRVTIFINKKIYPMYYQQIEDLWHRLAQKWKVILDDNKQLSGFNPGFIMLNYNKENYQISFTQYVKCQIIQSATSQLLMTTDKMIIAALAMRDIICFYEKKSLSVDILQEEIQKNDGRIQDMAKSICQCIRNYYGICRQIMAKVQKLIVY